MEERDTTHSELHEKLRSALLHHAVLVRGNSENILPLLESVLACAFTKAPDADIEYLKRESFGIDDVRLLTQIAYRRPVVRTTLRTIVVLDALTFEAQNALLKLTEDPPATAQFVFVVPHSLPVLPTFRSRLVEVVATDDAPGDTEHRDGVRATIGTVLEQIGAMAKAGDSGAQEAFLREAEVRARERGSTAYLEAVLTARRYIEARGSSSKMLLENVALAEHESRG